VPPSQSVALFKQCRARKLLITPPSMEHNTNLFSDASFLAVPAINFFGLPGYQQDTPPQMPHRFFEDGRQAFLLRKASKRKNGQEKEKEKDKESSSNPWFLLCGCPTLRGRAGDQSAGDSPRGPMEHGPKMDGREYEWEPENGPDSLVEAGVNSTELAGSPSTAARETAAAAAAARAGAERDRYANSQGRNQWREMQDFQEVDNNNWSA